MRDDRRDSRGGRGNDRRNSRGGRDDDRRDSRGRRDDRRYSRNDGERSGKRSYGAGSNKSNSERRDYKKNNQKNFGFEQNEGYQNEAFEDSASMESFNSNGNANLVEGRNPVLEAFRSENSVDRLYVQEGIFDGTVQTIIREAKKTDCIIEYVEKERLDQMSSTGHHQGVIAKACAYHYTELEDLMNSIKEKGEDPFLIILDGIEDPHNLGAIIRTANQAGAHGVIIPKHRAVGLTATVARTSAGAINYTPVCKVTNISQTMDALKEQGIWFVAADMDGEVMYKQNLKGPIGLVIGNEGNGVSRLVKEHCDLIASIPMKGQIDSLNASVAAGILSYEVVRQRMGM